MKTDSIGAPNPLAAGSLHTLWEFAAPHRRALLVGMGLMLAESASALVIPALGGLLAGGLLGERAASLDVRTVLWALLGLFALQALLRFVSANVLQGVADRVIAGLKVRLYDHLQALPLRYFHERRLGDTLALLANDVYVVGDFISGTAVAVVPLMVTAAGAVILMFGIRADLGLLALVLIPLFYLAMKVIGRRLRPLSVQLQEEEAQGVAMAQENLAMLPAIKTFTREAHESARFRGQVARIVDLLRQQRRIYTALGPLVQFIAGAAIILVFALVSGDVLAGRMSAAQLVAFLLYAQLLTRPIAGLADLYGHTQGVRGAAARLQRAMAEPAEEGGEGELAIREGGVEFHGVSFGYGGRELVLDRLDLRLDARTVTALVGPNGAGKSTVAHLLMRLHDPSAGRITIDGQDIARVSLESLRRSIGVVPQHVLLFNASIHDNIAYGSPLIPAFSPRGEGEVRVRAAVEAAARAAQAHDFIMQLPAGYDTVVGDRGVRLSGGEQQRLALARALLKDPRILILDEATAMWDSQGEAAFLELLRGGLAGRTVILITHRPSILAAADRVIHLAAPGPPAEPGG